MASIYDKASLVLIPSGTKTSKVYSQKPVSGDGDFTFSRSTAATRVNADGNIEKETQNLLLQSNSFDTTWVKSGVTLASGQAGYDGTNNAWELTRSTSAYSRLDQSITQSGIYRHSVYAKAGTLDWVSVGPSGGAEGTWFNLTTGEQGEQGYLIIDSSIQSAGNGWWRISVLINNPVNQFFRIYPADVDGGDDSTTAGTIYIQDAQLEQGLVARDYIETTTAAIYGGITDNVPRLDYTDSSCPALLLEPQRTNSLPQSEYFGDWSNLSDGTGSSAVLTANDAISPEGVQNAYKIVFNAGSGTTSGDSSQLSKSITFPNNTDGTSSIYLKGENGGEQIVFRGVADGAYTLLTLTTEWQRFDTTENSGTTSDGITFGIRQNVSGLGVINSSATIYAYGAQIEEGSYATSYIPTYGSAVTRNTEPNAMDKVDLITDGFFSSTELTWFIDVDLYEKDGGSTVAPRLISSSNNQVFIGFNTGSAGTTFSIRHKDGTTALNTSSISFDENGQRVKVLVKISGTTGKAFINGTSVGTFTTLAASNYDKFNNAQNNPYNINKMLLFSTALTDQEAIDLTTL